MTDPAVIGATAEHPRCGGEAVVIAVTRYGWSPRTDLTWRCRKCGTQGVGHV